ncbi:2-oxo acid dehydrogenase subunit E2 [Haloterrigena alkaliphila]|uniref:2-oxo acid dehydrogenase subunit E2 n=1 Tax=Haloterrigena alkaliphila TaxID=2816475 RepID=A0A8A2VAH7_9EURY|nr:2-oxo acid dehydrogenase subunit E2 [Haloterrigena alkaliphila]QSW97720.1 2-oxo acid dehydrogenase subunit E2 [Haloterrigena alkaliphila]
MRTEFELPDVGEGVAEGELVTWHVAVGDTVEEDQVLAEVETDKALVEIPSPYDGEVAELRAEEGEVVPVGDVLVVFEVDDASGDEADTSADPDEDATTEGDADETSADPSESVDAVESTVPEGRVFAAPSVRRLAREERVDIATLGGNGTGNRVTERDVREAAGEASAPMTAESAEIPGVEDADAEAETADADESAAAAARDGSAAAAPGGPAAASGTSAATGTASANDRGQSGALETLESRDGADRDRTLAMPATRRLARDEGVDIDDVPASEQRDGESFVTPADVSAFAAGDRSSPAPAGDGTSASSAGQGGTDGSDGPTAGDRIPYTGVRRTIGEQMATSKFTAPHVSHHDEVEVSELVDARSRLKARAEERGVKLTYLPFAVKAVVAALQSVPSLNAELDEEAEEIVVHDEYNIGIAVATDAGLMVPVIDDADEKGLLELARDINDKAERARNRRISPDEMQGGTFTITNIGAIGGEYASPIINYPEAGILALGSLKERPWVEDGDVVARPTMPISMSVDHRLVDGAEAAQFTNEVKRYLNAPALLLLE